MPSRRCCPERPRRRGISATTVVAPVDAPRPLRPRKTTMHRQWSPARFPLPHPPMPRPPAPLPSWALTRTVTVAGHVSTDLGCADGLDAGSLDRFFAQRLGPVLGWDYQHVYPLGQARHLWLFQDTFVDHTGAAGTPRTVELRPQRCDDPGRPVLPAAAPRHPGPPSGVRAGYRQPHAQRPGSGPRAAN